MNYAMINTESDNGEEAVRVFVSLDMEGVAGVVNWPEFDNPGSPAYHRAREQALAEVLGVVKGLHLGAEEIGEKLEEVTLADSHALGLNLDPHKLPREVSLIRGSPRPNYMLSGLDADHAFACFIGYHSRVGEPQALMDHSYSGSAVYRLTLNGDVVGETELNAAYAAHYGVPLGLASGDSAYGKQVREAFGESVSFVVTKDGISRFAARVRHPEVVVEELTEAAREAVHHWHEGKLKVRGYKAPFVLEVELTETLMADLADLYPSFERVGGRLIRITHNDFPTLYRAYMGLLFVCFGVKRARQGA